MQYKYRSAQAMNNAMRATVESAMNDVYERLLNRLIFLIQRDVYSAYSPEFYERTEDLLDRNNWEIKKWKRGDNVYREIIFKNEGLSNPMFNGDTHDPAAYIHGNYVKSFTKSNVFLRMLNNEIPQGNAFNFPRVDRRPFWDDFMDYCDRYYRTLLMNACRRRGFTIY